ncbi:D-lactaldehyde dehydrogenase [Lenzites betulinus]|nr:D-lactaldehyde dehydrogenase [Lenzites betulinus]
MPAITPESKVLVTGANGYVGMWVVRTLLEHGFLVRAVVRAAARGDFVKSTFSSYGDRLELVVVPDIEADGAFDEVVKGVDAIEHLASPYHWNAVEPDDIIQPAVRGTLSILNSALKNGSQVRRIVITTSTAAMVRLTNVPHTYTEDDWNDEAVDIVQREGRNSPNALKYFASKVLAERAAWKFYEDHKNEVAWDITTIAPPAIFGPILNEVASLASANASIIEWHMTVLQNAKDNAALTTNGMAWVDVRDVALAHVRAIERPEAGAQRITVNKESFMWQDWLDAARALSPQPYTRGSIARGDATYDASQAAHLYAFDTARMERLLGMPRDSLVSIAQSTRDMLADFEKRGW